MFDILVFVLWLLWARFGVLSLLSCGVDIVEGERERGKEQECWSKVTILSICKKKNTQQQSKKTHNNKAKKTHNNKAKKHTTTKHFIHTIFIFFY